MAIFKVKGSPFYQFAFTMEGHRYRGSTKSKKITEAKAVEAALIAKAKARGSSALRPAKAPLLRDFAPRFLKWVAGSKLEPNSKRYYQYGWNLIAATDLAAMRLSSITKDDVEATRFKRQVKKHGKINDVECSAQYANQALRTLKRMLSKAKEWSLISETPSPQTGEGIRTRPPDRLGDRKVTHARPVCPGKARAHPSHARTTARFSYHRTGFRHASE